MLYSLRLFFLGVENGQQGHCHLSNAYPEYKPSPQKFRKKVNDRVSPTAEHAKKAHRSKFRMHDSESGEIRFLHFAGHGRKVAFFPTLPPLEK